MQNLQESNLGLHRQIVVLQRSLEEVELRGESLPDAPITFLDEVYQESLR